MPPAPHRSDVGALGMYAPNKTIKLQRNHILDRGASFTNFKLLNHLLPDAARQTIKSIFERFGKMALIVKA